MNQEESIALYKEGVDSWNKWANEMLAQKQALEDDKQWQIDVSGEGGNDSTKNWIQKASVDFSGCVFEQNSGFMSHTFPYTANFSKSKFNGSITNFQGSEFKGNALFCEAEFNSDSVFYNTEFHSNVEFHKAFFNSRVAFYETKFHCYATFRGAKFQTCEFWRTEFFDSASFVDSKFVEKACFNNTKFHSGAYFRRSAFKSEATFSETNFIGCLAFTSATFNDIVDFDKTTFSVAVAFDEACFKKRVSFNKAIFEGESSFVAMNAQSFFSLEGTEFHFVPDFNQANFIQAPQFDSTNFSNARKYEQYHKSLNLAARWRSLKRLAAQNHDREHESIFFIEEIKSKRWKQYVSIHHPMYWFEWLYGFFSDFGRSVLRPLCWLAVLTCIYFGIYMRSDAESDAERFPVCNHAEAAAYLAVRNALPFPVTHSDKLTQSYACLYGKNIEGEARIPNTIVFLGILQTMLSTILIFLSLFALRNHFKIS